MLFWSVGVLLTNAYNAYLRVNEDEGVTKKSDGLLTHYEFRKSIALYWINPELVEKRNHLLGEVVEENSAVARCLNFPSTVSTLTGATFDSTSHPQCTPLSDASLKESAALGCRLDRTLPHIPTIAPSKKVKCSMHRWLGARKEGQLLYCPSCNVHLYVLVAIMIFIVFLIWLVPSRCSFTSSEVQRISVQIIVGMREIRREKRSNQIGCR